MSTRFPQASARLILGAGLGTLLFVLLPRDWNWGARALCGWNLFCAFNLLRLSMLLRFSGEQTEAHATQEDETRSVAATLTTLAALISLVGVFLTLHAAAVAKAVQERYWLTGLAVLTVALSWLLVQAEYMLHYARRFYADGAGVQFVQSGSDDPLPDPNYFDFLYLSLTIGMTYQVSDTDLDTPAMRRLLLGHAALSYFFNVVIVAVTVSGVAGLLG